MDQTNRNNETPLHIASQNGHLEIVKLLIASGGLVNDANRDGETPLHLATSTGNLEVIKVLIASSADLDCKDETGKTPLLSFNFLII